MARKITDPKKGVAVRITPDNSKKVIKVIEKTHRTFASEVNVAVEEYADKKIHEYKDDGR